MERWGVWNRIVHDDVREKIRAGCLILLHVIWLYNFNSWLEEEKIVGGGG